MALAEARAIWQRTANRCLVQEDAKRAPKLACCSPVPPSIKQAGTVPNASGGQDVPSTVSMPFSLNPSYSNLSPNSKWWLCLQPNYGHQKGLLDEQFYSLQGSMETCDPGLVDQTTSEKLFCDNQFRIAATGDKKDFGVKEDVQELKVEALCPEVSKNANEPYFNSKSSSAGAEKNTPWWRTADTDELASLVAQSSLDYIENCDLPRPQNTRVKKDVDVNICSSPHDGISSSLLDPKLGAGSKDHHNSHLHAAGSPTAASACRNISVSDEGLSVSSADKPLWDIPTHEGMLKMHPFEGDASKAQLMEALCHSQTRAREAERAAKQACAEKEHLVKLVIRQASQLFAYKQLLQLLQLESMYLQFINNSSQSLSMIFPPMSPSTPEGTSKMQRSRHTSSSGKRSKQCCPEYEASKYAVVFALGLGLAGAGFLLGWTVGWILPSW